MGRKSIHDLRVQAQALGVDDVFKLDYQGLRQQIDLKTRAAVPQQEPPPPKPEYDARLMTKRPGLVGDRDEIEQLLARYIGNGLKLTFPDEESWQMAKGIKSDTGSMRMPLRDVLKCAEALLR